jgi:hypothetical protein
MNGSAAIHDYEIARFGATSRGRGRRTEGRHLRNGRGDRARPQRGLRHRPYARLGNGRGRRPRCCTPNRKLAHPEQSVILAAHALWIPVTVHAALGAEIIHQHPAADGAAIGDTSHRDFRRLAAACEDLHEGGVVLNLGSAVIMPEVFLKALTVARNVLQGTPTDFTTADFDMHATTGRA